MMMMIDDDHDDDDYGMVILFNRMIRAWHIVQPDLSIRHWWLVYRYRLISLSFSVIRRSNVADRRRISAVIHVAVSLASDWPQRQLSRLFIRHSVTHPNAAAAAAAVALMPYVAHSICQLIRFPRWFVCFPVEVCTATETEPHSRQSPREHCTHPTVSH